MDTGNNSNLNGIIVGTLPAMYRGIAAGGIATHIGGLITNLKLRGANICITYHKPFNVKHPDVISSTKLSWVVMVVRGLILLLKNRNFQFRRYSIKNIIFIAYYLSVLSLLLKRKSPSFIHIHSLYNPASIAIKLLKYNGNIIITDHGFWVDKKYPKDKKIVNLLIESYNVADKVIYLSKYGFDQHIQAKFGTLSKLVKIPNPSSFDEYPCRNLSEDRSLPRKKSLIFNGYGDSIKTKGLLFLLQAVNENPYLCRNILLIIICNQEAKEYIKQHKWNFEYKVYGRLPFVDVLNLYRESDILVVPSRVESFGLVYTEALAVGIPVVGYHKMIKEFSEELDTYIGEPMDIETETPNDLAIKIIKCLNTSFDAKLVRVRLRSKYDWNYKIDDFIRLYESPKEC